jgi:hypothetical protein
VERMKSSVPNVIIWDSYFSRTSLCVDLTPEEWILL